MYAACELMKKQNVEVMGCMVVIELNGVEKLKPNTLFSLVQYWGQNNSKCSIQYGLEHTTLMQFTVLQFLPNCNELWWRRTIKQMAFIL